MARLAVHIYHGHAAQIRERILAAATEPRAVIALSDRAQLRDAMPAIEVLFAPMPPRDGWAAADKLALIQLMGSGVDQLLPSPDLPARVEVAGVRGVFAAEVAEHAIGLMFALSRKLPEVLALQRQHVFDQRSTLALRGKTLTILGLGEIGARLARVAAALDMRVIGISRGGRPIEHVEQVFAIAEWGAALAAADYLVIAVPHTDDTAGMIDSAALAQLPAGAFVINVARGGIVDEAALLAALRSGHLAGAACDVFEAEPLPPTSSLWDAPNLIITPHMAGYGKDYTGRCIDVLLDNVRRLETGAPRRCLVDRSRGY